MSSPAPINTIVYMPLEPVEEEGDVDPSLLPQLLPVLVGLLAFIGVLFALAAVGVRVGPTFVLLGGVSFYLLFLWQLREGLRWPRGHEWAKLIGTAGLPALDFLF